MCAQHRGTYVDINGQPESALSFYLVGFRGPTVVTKLSSLLSLLSLTIIFNVEQQKFRFNTPEGSEATVPSRRPAPSVLFPTPGAL